MYSKRSPFVCIIHFGGFVIASLIPCLLEKLVLIASHL